jgi:hypothetical protein
LIRKNDSLAVTLIQSVDRKTLKITKTRVIANKPRNKKNQELNVGMEELEEQNFETLFLENENHLVLQKIFLYLDPKSLRNASLVNSR